jgi:flagellar biosynthesis protein FlhB
MEDKPLARALYAKVPVGRVIPADYWTMVWKILEQIYAWDSENARLVRRKAG